MHGLQFPLIVFLPYLVTEMETTFESGLYSPSLLIHEL